MMKKSLLCLLAALLCSAVWAAGPELKPSQPGTYTVKRGDTLWDISGRFLVKPWRWPEIWRANPQVENPHLIYPGDVLVLRYVDGRPVLSVEGGERHLGGRDFKLSPSVRAEPHARAISAIPLDVIQPFLSRPALVSQAELDRAPYVLAGDERHIITGVGDIIYARGLTDPSVRTYTIYRKGRPLRRGPDAELLGFEAIEVGEAVLERPGDPAVLRIVRAERETRVGDSLFAQDARAYPEFMPRAPETPVEASVISLLDAVGKVGTWQVVALDAGRAAGLQPGDVLNVYQSGETVPDTVAARRERDNPEPIRFERYDSNPLDAILSNLFTDIRNTRRDLDAFFDVEYALNAEDVELPERYVGRLMVFRTFERVSFALVMSVNRPLGLNDLARSP